MIFYIFISSSGLSSKFAVYMIVRPLTELFAFSFAMIDLSAIPETVCIK